MLRQRHQTLPVVRVVGEVVVYEREYGGAGGLCSVVIAKITRRTALAWSSYNSSLQFQASFKYDYRMDFEAIALRSCVI